MPRGLVRLQQIEPRDLNVDARVEIATAAGVSQCAFRTVELSVRSPMTLHCSM